MLITLNFPPGLTSWSPDAPWLPRGTHPVYVPDQSGLVTVDTTKAPLNQLLAAGFSPTGGYVYAPGA